MTAPCEWSVSYASCEDDTEWAALPDDGRERYEDAAVEFLWRWTGRVLGICEVSIRPCRARVGLERPSTWEGRGPRPHGGSQWQPVLIGGEWFNLTCFSCADLCSCSRTTALSLPGPVESVVAVKIDGEVLDPSTYRLDSGKWLIRLDGQGWPSSQDMSAPTSAPDTFEVTYRRGLPVPPGGQIAAGVLAMELWRAACGSPACGLPQRFQSITRQGVTVAMLDSFEDIDKGHTGIFLIDSWVASFVKPQAVSKVLSPDVGRGRGSRRA